MSDIDALVHAVRPPSGAASGALVLMHGRGTSEQDLLPLADVLDPTGRLAVVAPRAPLRIGPSGYHWYVVPRVGYPDRETFEDSSGRLGTFLDALPEVLGVPWGRTVLGGFSMGAVMSYVMGLGEGRRRPAAVMPMSGFIPTVDGFTLDLAEAEGFPVAICHGTLDPVISVEFARDARRRLTDCGLDVAYQEFSGGHHTDPTWLGYLRDSWLPRVLPDPD